jgi:hypothetical protein
MSGGKSSPFSTASAFLLASSSRNLFLVRTSSLQIMKIGGKKCDEKEENFQMIL